ncbi:hypothetical protein SAMN02745751_02362 [Dethiosulfatibacter aminovorans DSM 17477]|uniref:Uncharacterized protein n=1 Tax=Dethiosulfatibacter aminovorans DSM 17477 TaxID=1121476 RepID=A0A1M6IK43_9FIRM|nr:hypothetical protein [Dethiosulfatibacter aminovorans]SHJ34846.1 hypothetical protein SAMN02745751_02362 [Dethiosulfatibacter aminovorans DSM 17477]
MEKETFIYKRKLDGIVREIYEKFNVRIIFCEIFGNRWSWLAGSDEYFMLQKRVRISDVLGFIVEDGVDENLLHQVKTSVACSIQ